MKTTYLVINIVKALTMTVFAIVNAYWMGVNIKKRRAEQN